MTNGCHSSCFVIGHDIQCYDDGFYGDWVRRVIGPYLYLAKTAVCAQLASSCLDLIKPVPK